MAAELRERGVAEASGEVNARERALRGGIVEAGAGVLAGIEEIPDGLVLCDEVQLLGAQRTGRAVSAVEGHGVLCRGAAQLRTGERAVRLQKAVIERRAGERDDAAELLRVRETVHPCGVAAHGVARDEVILPPRRAVEITAHEGHQLIEEKVLKEKAVGILRAVREIAVRRVRNDRHDAALQTKARHIAAAPAVQPAVEQPEHRVAAAARVIFSRLLSCRDVRQDDRDDSRSVEPDGV